MQLQKKEKEAKRKMLREEMERKRKEAELEQERGEFDLSFVHPPVLYTTLQGGYRLDRKGV